TIKVQQAAAEVSVWGTRRTIIKQTVGRRRQRRSRGQEGAAPAIKRPAMLGGTDGQEPGDGGGPKDGGRTTGPGGSDGRDVRYQNQGEQVEGGDGPGDRLRFLATESDDETTRR
ncbi:hypothetical protein NPIL_487031, partial [Nephila pilipes]